MHTYIACLESRLSNNYYYSLLGSHFSVENVQKYASHIILSEYDYSLEEFLTNDAITTWRQLICSMDRMNQFIYVDSIRNFAEPVTGNLGEIPYSITHIPLLTFD